MKIVMGSDHAGFRLKEELKKYASDASHEVVDVGTHSTESVDYPDFAAAVAVQVAASTDGALGVLVCGSGIGVSIAANKVRGARAALCSEPFSARLAREHNDANVLCLGERIVGAGLATEILQAFLSASFAGGRHARRVDKIAELDGK